MTCPGTLRNRITFQEEAETADDGGGYALAWTNITTAPSVWASIEALSGREALRAMQLEHPVSHQIICRHRTDITAKMRIKYGTRMFNIRAVLLDENQKRFMTILAEEFVAI